MEPSVQEGLVEVGATCESGEQVTKYFETIDEKSNGSLQQPLQENGTSEPLETESSQALIVVDQQTLDSPNEKLQLVVAGEASSDDVSMAGGALNRDMVLAKLNKEKVLSFIKAWEENEKRKSMNSFQKKIVKIKAWEVAEKARAEASLRTAEERLENEKAACIERANNTIAQVQKIAEQELALAESKQGRDISKTEEIAAKCRASGTQPWRFPFCC